MINPDEERQIIARIKQAIDFNDADRFLAKRILRTIEAEGRAAKKPFVSFRNIAVVFALAIALFSAGSLISRESLPAGKGNPGILQKALAAVEQPNTVTHYKIGNQSTTNGYDEPVDDTTVELWLSPNEGKAKFIEHFINRTVRSGEPQMTGYAVVIAANRISTAREWDGGKIEAEDLPLEETGRPARTGFRGYLIEATKQYPRLLKERKLRVTGEERVNGIDTYKLEPASMDDISIDLVNVRKDDYQPVRIVHQVTEEPGPKTVTEQGGPEPDAGGQSRTYVVTSSFNEVSLVDSSSLGPDFFSLGDQLKNKDYRLDATYSLEEAKRFDKFDLFYLGESFQGYSLDATQGVGYHHRLKEPLFPEERGPKLSWSEVAGMTYYRQDDGNSAAPIGIGIYPGLAPSEIEELIPAKDLANLSKTTVEVDGIEAVVIEGNYKGLAAGYSGYTSELYINKGNATVRIEADSKELVIKAANTLRKLN